MKKLSFPPLNFFFIQEINTYRFERAVGNAFNPFSDPFDGVDF